MSLDKISIGIATTGRKNILFHAVKSVSVQTRPVDKIIICAVSPDDVDEKILRTFNLPLDIVYSKSGLAHQRNVILDMVNDFDCIVFIDDDFLVRPNYVETTISVLDNNADIAMVTGTVIADGARNAGIDLLAAYEIIGRPPLYGQNSPSGQHVEDVFSAYGCNMAIRLQPVFQHDLRFNESLPLYGWLEDMDFSRQMSRFGRIVRALAPQGVHLAVKQGRVSGFRYGYSQIANPIHLYGRGLIPLRTVVSHAGKNLLSNALRALHGETYIDRRGRLLGNLRAVLDLLRGRLNPAEILKF